MMRYKTGQKAPRTSTYAWVCYTDGTQVPLPTKEEMSIRLTRGETFPPIRSCNKAAYWR